MFLGSDTFKVVIAICLGCTQSGQASAEVLLSDDFSGSAGDYINSSLWRVPPGGPGAFYGLTAVQTSLDDLPTTDGDAAVLELHTYTSGNSPGNPNNRVAGAEFQSRSSYAIGGGLIWEATARLGSSRDGGTGSGGEPISAPPSGFVGGAFLYDVVNDKNAAGNPPVRDEADFELLSKQPNSSLTNTFNDDGFTGPAGFPSLLFNPVPGYSPFNYHDYRMEITPSGPTNRIDYYIDDILVRTVTNSDVPDEAMTPHFNLWLPDSSFGIAYDGNLSAGTPGSDAIYTMSVDSVSLTRINTARGANIVPNSGFTNTSDWNFFNNATSSSANGSSDGDGFALRTVDPFNGGFDASGIFQTFTGISAGDEVSLTVDVNAPSAENIVGNGGTHFAEIIVRFLDGVGGNILAERVGIPMNNGDPNLVQDQWLPISIEGTAPAGTNAVFVQLGHISNIGGGAIYWDNVDLAILTATDPVIEGDYDGNGFVSQSDLDVVLLNWGSSNFPGDENAIPGGGPFDGLMGQNELDGVLLNWGDTSLAVSQSTIPEPHSLLLLVLGLSVSNSRRKSHYKR